MMISVFAWLSVGTPTKPTIVQPIVNHPTSNPSPTNSQNNPTPIINSTKTQNMASLFTSAFVNLADAIVSRPPGLIESNPNLTATVWRTVAANAWQYFQPGTGVDSNSGLPRASLTFFYFTDWDLGVYIQAVIDANKTGLIGYDGNWGSIARIEKVLTFLETRELNNASYPFWFYQASDGKEYRAATELSSSLVDPVDTGRLFVALNNLKIFNSNLTSRIDNFVYNKFGNRSNYALLVPGVLNDCNSSISIYTYYVASGFASFWPNELAGATDKILTNINNAGTIQTFGVTLPNATISCEPLLCSVFELNNNSKLTALAKQVYSAHEAKYNATGQYVAFSEGNTQTGFIYEWVVLPTGETWKITDGVTNLPSSISNPIIFTKVSTSFLALYNTSFARNMAIYLEQSLPDSRSGYYAGADYNTIGNANLVLSIDSNSNGMILGASRYSLQNFR
jgi:hypothetical protein